MITARTSIKLETTLVDEDSGKKNERIVSVTLNSDGTINADCHVDFGGSLVWDIENATSLEDIKRNRAGLGMTNVDFAIVRQNLRYARGTLRTPKPPKQSKIKTMGFEIVTPNVHDFI